MIDFFSNTYYEDDFAMIISISFFALKFCISGCANIRNFNFDKITLSLVIHLFIISNFLHLACQIVNY